VIVVPPWTAVEFGLRIKEIRQLMGLSISEVARRGKFERKHLVHLERGHSYPSATTLRKLALIFQCSIDLILNVCTEPDRDDSANITPELVI
jgi:transcriptional regulator with XRE-family HTH domain